MDCLSAQTQITAYVEGRLKGNDLKKFLLHMEDCPNCREELEIYYTLIEGTRQLDEGILTTSNFAEELDHKIKTELEAIKEQENLIKRSRFFSFLLILIFGVIALAEILNLSIPHMIETSMNQIERLDIK